MKIYVAGPYSSATPEGRLNHTNRAIYVGITLIRTGHVPFIPHLSHFTNEEAIRRFGNEISWKTWIAQDLEWVRVCDALYRLPGESKGADLEEKEARRIGIPVYYDLDQIPYPQSPGGKIQETKTDG